MAACLASVVGHQRGKVKLQQKCTEQCYRVELLRKGKILQLPSLSQAANLWSLVSRCLSFNTFLKEYYKFQGKKKRSSEHLSLYTNCKIWTALRDGGVVILMPIFYATTVHGNIRLGIWICRPCLPSPAPRALLWRTLVSSSTRICV